MSLGLVACTDDGGGEEMANDDTTGTPGDGDGDPGDGDGAPGECIEPPEECLRLVSCIGEVLPDQLETVEGQYGPEGSCWCGGVDMANECYTTCLQQLDAALGAFPTEPACHPKSCGIEELDPSQPYGPVENGACPVWSGQQQIPVMGAQLGITGDFCSPPCSGIAQSCPDHTQTVAEGTCFLNAGDTSYCVSRCYINSVDLFPSGTQCQCGARCQPYGPSDGEGNMRGLCTFE